MNAMLIVLTAGLFASATGVFFSSAVSLSQRNAHFSDSLQIADSALGNAVESLANLTRGYVIYERPHWDGTIEWLNRAPMEAWVLDTSKGPRFTYNQCNTRALLAQIGTLFAPDPEPPNVHACTDPAKTLLTSDVDFTTVKNNYPASPTEVPPDGTYTLDVKGKTTIAASLKGDKAGAGIQARIDLPPPLPWCKLTPPDQTIACEDKALLDLVTAASDKSLRVLVNGNEVSITPGIKGGTFAFDPMALEPGKPVVRSNIINDFCGKFTYVPPQTICGKNGCTTIPEQYIPGPDAVNEIVVEAKGYGVSKPWDQYNTTTCGPATVRVHAPAFVPAPAPTPIPTPPTVVMAPTPIIPPEQPQPQPPVVNLCPNLGQWFFDNNGCIGRSYEVTGCVGACETADVYCGGKFKYHRTCPPGPVGCFHPDTRILMANGRWKKAKHVRHGDYLWNPLTNGPVRVEFLSVGPELVPMVELGYDDVRLSITAKHPMVTSRGVRRADELAIGDLVLGADGRFHELTRLTRPRLPSNLEVYNFQLGDMEEGNADHHMIVAEGIVTGDLVLQTLLEAKRSFPFSALAPGWRPDFYKEVNRAKLEKRTTRLEPAGDDSQRRHRRARYPGGKPDHG